MKKNLAVKILASLPFIAVFSLGQSASATVFDWSFENQNGNIGVIGDTVSGFVEFNDADVLPNATNVSAIDLQITNVSADFTAVSPFFGDGGIELNTNLLGDGLFNTPQSLTNEFDFDGSSQIIASRFVALYLDNLSNQETLGLNTGGVSELEDRVVGGRGGDTILELSDTDSSSLVFSEQTAASVPFEFSPTWGIFLVGSVFGFARYQKYRQLNQLSQ